jgi:flagellar motor component MotA
MFRKLWLPILIVAAAFAFIAIMSGVGLSTFVDLPSFAIVPTLPLLVTCLAFGAAGVRAAFTAPFAKSANKADLKVCLAFFRSLGTSSIVFGAMGSLMGTVAMMKNLTDRTKVGPNMAIALLTMMYAVLVWALVVLPFTLNAEKRLAETD